MSMTRRTPTPTRRQVLAAGLGALVSVRPAAATADELAAAISAFAAGATLREGRVKLDVAPLVENGNTVPITVARSPPGPATTTTFARTRTSAWPP